MAFITTALQAIIAHVDLVSVSIYRHRPSPTSRLIITGTQRGYWNAVFVGDASQFARWCSRKSDAVAALGASSPAPRRFSDWIVVADSLTLKLTQAL